VSQYLISFFNLANVKFGRVHVPPSVHELATLVIAAEYIDNTYLRILPRIDVRRDVRWWYFREGEDEDCVEGGVVGSGSGGGTTRAGREVI
jgi:hypothetical protein